MKYFYLPLLFLVAFGFVACSEVKSPLKETRKSQNSAEVSLIMHDDSKYKNSYRVYINNRDLNTTLTSNVESNFEVKVGKTNIQVVRNRETASIDLETLMNRTYKLRVFVDERGHIQLLQVANSLNE